MPKQPFQGTETTLQGAETTLQGAETTLQGAETTFSRCRNNLFKVPKKSAHNNIIANIMVYPPQYLIKTKSFITNLIEEGKVVEANRLLKLENINQLQILSSEDSDIGRIIRSDIIKLNNLLRLCFTLL